MSWIFMAFENDSAHKKGKPFMIELFHDFNKLKRFSAQQEVSYRNVHNHYCSDYINLNKRGARSIAKGEIHINKGEIIIVGDVDVDDESHNCDQMGCSSVSHVIYRSEARNEMH